MRAWLLTLLALVGLALTARAQASDAAAIDTYRRGDFDAATRGWSELLADRSLPAAERARLCFNLGNAAFRAERPLEAVGWYEAALRLAPRDADAWANVEHARSAAGLEPKDRGDLAATLSRLAHAPTRAESGWLALVGLLACGAALAFEALRGGRVGRRIAWLGVLVALAAAAPWAVQRAASERDPLLVVEKDKALVRSEPRKDAAVVGEAAAGERVERLDTLLDWTKVDVDGTTGWVQSSQVFALER